MAKNTKKTQENKIEGKKFNPALDLIKKAAKSIAQDEKKSSKDTSKDTGKKASLPPVVVKIKTEESGSKFFIIKNLADYKEEKNVHKALKAVNVLEANDKNKEIVVKAIAAAGLKRATSEEIKAWEKAHAGDKKPEAKKPAPPKFDARKFVVTDKDDKDVEFVELGLAANPEGQLFVVQTERTNKKGKKIQENKLYVCMGVFEKTAWFCDMETEDAMPVLPEMVKARKMWKTKDDNSYTDKMKEQVTALLVPVKPVAQVAIKSA